MFPPRGARKKNSVNYTNCIRTIDCLCSKSTSRPAYSIFSVSEHPMQVGSTVQSLKIFLCVSCVCVGGEGGGEEAPLASPLYTPLLFYAEDLLLCTNYCHIACHKTVAEIT